MAHAAPPAALGAAPVLLMLLLGLPAFVAPEVIHMGDPVNGWVPGGPYPTLSTKVGDMLNFTFSGIHDVYILASEAASTSCNFSNSQLVGDSSPTLYNVTRSGMLYFACEVGMHCLSGQKQAVNVSAAGAGLTPPSATNSPPPPTSAVPAVCSFPSQGMLLALGMLLFLWI